MCVNKYMYIYIHVFFFIHVNIYTYISAALKNIGVTNLIHQKAVSSKLKATMSEAYTEETKIDFDGAGAGMSIY
jgi:hypothetical protein